MTYALTPQQEKEWVIALEIAILKQLYADKMLTDRQLNELICRIKNQD